MAVFMLNTDSVTVAAETLNTLATDVNSIISSVNGYSTSNDDGFAFDIAKSSIANNLEACKTKISNTMNAFKSVVSSHTNLQNSMKFGDDASDESGNQDNPEDYGGAGDIDYSGGAGGYGGSGGYGGNGGSEGPTLTEDLFSSPYFMNLIASGLFNIIKEEELNEFINDKITLVIKANKDDENDAEYIKIATEIAMAYNIPLTFVNLDDSKNENPSILLVKNGEVLKTYSGYQTSETIKKMFEEYKDELTDTSQTEVEPLLNDENQLENEELSSTNAVVTEEPQSLLDNSEELGLKTDDNSVYLQQSQNNTESSNQSSLNNFQYTQDSVIITNNSDNSGNISQSYRI